MDANLRTVDWLGRVCRVVVDRPLGSAHPEHPDIVYSVNYGYLPGTRAPDGEPLDVYVLGASGPLSECVVAIVAIVRRRDDAEDKLVGVVDTSATWSAETIAEAVRFQEQYFDSWIERAAD